MQTIVFAKEILKLKLINLILTILAERFKERILSDLYC